jgi:hypothetical protein
MLARQGHKYISYKYKRLLYNGEGVKDKGKRAVPAFHPKFHKNTNFLNKTSQNTPDKHCNYVAHEASCSQPETSQRRINGMNRIAQRICNLVCLMRSGTIITVARTAVQVSVNGRLKLPPALGKSLVCTIIVAHGPNRLAKPAHILVCVFMFTDQFPICQQKRMTPKTSQTNK